MSADAQVALAAAVDRLWVQYLPLTEERIAALETAARHLRKITFRLSSTKRRVRRRTSWPGCWGRLD